MTSSALASSSPIGPYRADLFGALNRYRLRWFVGVVDAVVAAAVFIKWVTKTRISILILLFYLLIPKNATCYNLFIFLFFITMLHVI